VYRGVTNIPKRRLWKAAIDYQGKELVIGFYQYETAAALAYNAKAKQLYGDKAKLNTVETAWETKIYQPVIKQKQAIVLPALEPRDDYYTSEQTQHLQQKKREEDGR
jgi:hypothetical protein